MIKEVDTVLATHELLDLFAEKGIDLASITPQTLPADSCADNEMSQAEVESL